MTSHFLVVFTNFLLSISCKHFAGHFFHFTSNMYLSPLYLQINHPYVPLLVGYQVFKCALQAISNKVYSANRGEKLKKQAAAFPSHSSAQTTAK